MVFDGFFSCVNVNLNEMNTTHDEMSDNSDNSTVKTPDSDCFTQPLPPPHLPVLRSANNTNHSSSLVTSTTTCDVESNPNPKPEKVKSRWRRNSELESGHGTEQSACNSASPSPGSGSLSNNASSQSPKSPPLAPLSNSSSINLPKETDPVPQYDHIDENIYLFERKKSKCKKEMRRMVCNCILTKEERQKGVLGCLDDCLNRMLMIECSNRCLLGDHCANKCFQKRQFSKVEPFKTQRKGWGLRAMQAIQPGQFIVEYVGEVLDPKEFKARVKKYSKENREHYYFMALKSDEIIDATIKGNLTRFINHSCDPNGETQKWTVNGELRIGFFASRLIESGEEITFDYQFQRYGKKAQKCYCEAFNCRGFIGSTNDTSINIDGSLITSKQKSLEKTEEEEKTLVEEFEDLGLEEEIAKLTAGGGIRNRQQTLMLARLMVRAEDTFNRTKLLEVLKRTQEIAYLRLFLDYHGLQLLWSWMVDLEDVYLKGEILEVLAILPIPNKTVLKDSKVLDVVERWAKLAESEASQRKDGVLSVNAQLPLIVEPSTTITTTIISSPLAVNVKKEDKQQDDQQQSMEIEISETKSTGKISHPSQPSSQSQQSNEGDGDDEEVTVKEEEEEEEEEEGETKQQPQELEATDEKEKKLQEEKGSNEPLIKTEEVNIQIKEETVDQNEIKVEKLDNPNGESCADTLMADEKENPIVDVQVEIELGCEVEVKQDINGIIGSEMAPSEDQAAPSTPVESVTSIKPEPIKARETRSSSTSSTTSSIDASSSSTSSTTPVIAERVIGRRVSVKSRNESNKDESNKENKVTKEMIKPVPDIAKLTSKLLYLWKDLKEVFRIPRLERQKRLEDEKEADRKAVEEQERKARGLPIVYDPKAKRGIDNRDNTIAGILRLRDLRKKTVKRSVDDKKPVQNNLTNSLSPASSTTPSGTVNNDPNAGPTPPKVNKEVHRMQFQMELMRKEYSDALNRYTEQMTQYQKQIELLASQHQQQQLPLTGLQPPPTHPGLNPATPQTPNFDSNHFPSNPLTSSLQSPYKSGQPFSSPNFMNLPLPLPPPPTPNLFPNAANLFPGYRVNNSDYPSNSGLSTPLTPIGPMTPLTPSNDYHGGQQSYNLESHHLNTSTTTSQQQQFSSPSSSQLLNNSEIQMKYQENKMHPNPPSIQPQLNPNRVLIECTVPHNHTLMSDEKAVISTDYGVEYVPVKKSKQALPSSSPSTSSSTKPNPEATPSTATVTPTTVTTPNKENNPSSSNCINRSNESRGNSKINLTDSHKTLFNSVYPCPGTYYLTPDDNCFFVPPPFDLHGHQVEPIVYENVPKPFLPRFTKESIQTALPPNWRCSKDASGNIYYYNKVTKMVSWDLPEVNLVTRRRRKPPVPPPVPVPVPSAQPAESDIPPDSTNCSSNNNNPSQDETAIQSQQSSLSIGHQTPVDTSQSHPTSHQPDSASSQPNPSLAEKKETCTDEMNSNNVDNSSSSSTLNPEPVNVNIDLSNSNGDGDTPSASTTAQPSKEPSPQASSDEALVNGGSGSPENVTTNDDSTSECMGTPSHTLPGSYEPDPRKRRSSSSNSTGTHHNNNINESKNSLAIVKNFSSLMEINDGDLIATARRDKTERKIKDKFKAEMSEHIKYCLNPYRKIDCRVGRILCNDDFKYVARRLTHFVMLKEIRHCRNIEDLCCSETVKHKAKEYVKKYMANKGPIYRPESDEKICKDKEKCSPNS